MEHLFFGKISTSASDDLVKAIEIARSVVTRYGMAPDLGQVASPDEDAGRLNAAESVIIADGELTAGHCRGG